MKKKGLDNYRVFKYFLFIYRFYVYLLMFNVWGEWGNYEKVLNFIMLYFNVVVDDFIVEDFIFIKRFKDWVEVNFYFYKLMLGDYEVLDFYLDFIDEDENEIFFGLVKVMEVVNLYNLNVDYVFRRFDLYIYFLFEEGNYEISYVV